MRAHLAVHHFLESFRHTWNLIGKLCLVFVHEFERCLGGGQVEQALIGADAHELSNACDVRT